MKKLDLTGQRFGRLVVIEISECRREKVMWLCLCDCGNENIAATSNLRRGKIKSCGCLRNELTKKRRTIHGQSYSNIYFVWSAMIKRCNNKNDKSYHRYGGRGITVCNRWSGQNGFINFIEDMGKRPVGLTIDRYPDNNGNYEQSNCRWATYKEQANNRRRKGVSSS